MRWTPNKSDDDPIEAVDLMGYILTASELMNDLLAEVKRLNKVIEIMSYRMDPFDEGCTLHEEKVCGGIEGKCFLCEEIKALQRGPYVWGENAPKSEAFYLEDGVWKKQKEMEE
tara:strand:+ start:4111 stop:4452 length:342 start_codon:yes stop_codon:yes gene_type:complete